MVRWENGEIQFLVARKRKESEVMCMLQVLIKVLRLDCGCTKDLTLGEAKRRA